jgi:hypothetical protein
VILVARISKGFQTSWSEARARNIRIILCAARQEPAPLEKPQSLP